MGGLSAIAKQKSLRSSSQTAEEPRRDGQKAACGLQAVRCPPLMRLN